MIRKLLLVNRILEELRLVHRLIVAPMKAAMKKRKMNKNNLQISMLTLPFSLVRSLISKMKIQQKFSRFSFSRSLSVLCSCHRNRHTLNTKTKAILENSVQLVVVLGVLLIPTSWCCCIFHLVCRFLGHICVYLVFLFFLFGSFSCSVCDYVAKIHSFIHSLKNIENNNNNKY